MNIFFLDNDPVRSANMHCDKHVCKMIIEYAQMLCSAHRLLDPSDQSDHDAMRLHKVAFPHHPMTQWVMESTGNYDWLYQQFCRLLEEYYFRYGWELNREHDHYRLRYHLSNCPRNMARGKWTFPPACMPVDYHRRSIVASYRDFYNHDKWHFCKWTFREQPDWFMPSGKSLTLEEQKDDEGTHNYYFDVDGIRRSPLFRNDTDAFSWLRDDACIMKDVCWESTIPAVWSENRMEVAR